MANETCLCPVCRKQSIPKRCTSFRNTCSKPKPECACKLHGIQAQLISGTDRFLGQGDIVPFNRVISSYGSTVNCNPEGDFIIEKNGTYLVNWEVAVEGCDTVPFVRFALVMGDKVHSAAAIPVTIGMLSGSAFVIAVEKTSLALVNDTGDIVRLQAVEPMANITIVYMG